MVTRNNTKIRYTFHNINKLCTITSTVKEMSDKHNESIKEIYQLTDGKIKVSKTGWIIQ